jgi:hypothetical protein
METKIKNPFKKANPNSCSVDMDINSDGTFQITHLKNPENCKKVLAEINPVRGVLWKSNIKQSEKKKAGID